MNKILILLSISLFSCGEKQYFVKRVKDGDTVVVNIDDKDKICRLYGIDAPEKSQPFGQEAKEALSDMVLNKKIKVEIIDHDMYNRSICVLDNGEKITVNERMVALGYAWAYVQYLKKDKDNLQKYLKYQSDAFFLKQGLWSQEDPEAPWEYRKKRIRGRKRSH